MQADQINENEMKLEFDARSVNEGFAILKISTKISGSNTNQKIPSITLPLFVKPP